jgi:hypothetical protein
VDEQSCCRTVRRSMAVVVVQGNHVVIRRKSIGLLDPIEGDSRREGVYGDRSSGIVWEQQC